MNFAAFGMALLWSCLLLLPAPEGVIAGGTRFSTPFFRLTSPEPGPTLLVVAGIHGDERAPPHAARALLDVKLARGTVVVVPEANKLALSVGRRHTPGTRYLDLNRTFPTLRAPTTRGQLGNALWQFVVAHDPDWVLDLHEGFDFNRQNPKSVGSSVTFVRHSSVGACSERLARHVAREINGTISQRSRHFTVLSPGPSGSFARSIAETLGAPTLVFETTRIGQTLALRVSQHRVMLDAVLEKLGLVGGPSVPSCGV